MREQAGRERLRHPDPQRSLGGELTQSRDVAAHAGVAARAVRLGVRIGCGVVVQGHREMLSTVLPVVAAESERAMSA